MNLSDFWQVVSVSFFTFSVLAIYYLMSVFKVGVFEPPKMLLISWIAMSLLLMSGIVVYDKVFVIETFLSTLMGIVAFVFGAILYRGTENRYSITWCLHSNCLTYSKQSLGVLLIFGVFYVALEGGEILKTIRNSGLAGLSLQILYAEHWNEYHTEGKELIDIVKNIGQSCAFILSVSLPYFITKRKWVLTFIASICLGMIVAGAVIEGTRFLIVLTIAVTVYFGFELKKVDTTLMRGNICRNRLLKRTACYVSVAAFVVIIFVVFPAVRKPDLVEGVASSLSRHHESYMGEWVKDMSRISGLGWMPIFAFGSSYLSHPIVKYTFFVENSDIGSWYEGGKYNFPLFGRVSGFVKNETTGRGEIRERISKISKAHGYTTNPWATGIRDLVIDFGYFGTVIILFFLGYLAQMGYQKSRRSRRVEYRIMAALIGISCSIFAFLSPLGLGILLNTFVVSFSMIFMAKLTISDSSKKLESM